MIPRQVLDAAIATHGYRERRVDGRAGRGAEATPGAWLNGRRVMAIDGFVVDLPDTEANVAEFGRDSAGGYETAFPQARVVAISECAGHDVTEVPALGEDVSSKESQWER
ncbi:hypothetical protein [Nonomuraea coxensis]|uniref:hypothetical protein n=1 Tax=Nonomuraea coxensis TaxID=404386 RepID=UPI0012F814A7|nr:hypothetical protein [Nonomuraea coxensis]